MVQYKMLEADRRDGRRDWIYRPDKQLAIEIKRMKRFMDARPPGPLEYRINQQVFYLKFVPREARWQNLQNQATRPDIATLIDDAIPGRWAADDMQVDEVTVS